MILDYIYSVLGYQILSDNEIDTLMDSEYRRGSVDASMRMLNYFSILCKNLTEKYIRKNDITPYVRKKIMYILDDIQKSIEIKKSDLRNTPRYSKIKNANRAVI